MRRDVQDNQSMTPHMSIVIVNSTSTWNQSNSVLISKVNRDWMLIASKIYKSKDYNIL